jgi:3-phenylpropionate/cinnamic acid dioxygenase small subunit
VAPNPIERADRDDVTDVLVRYATGIDTRDWALLRTCFSDDCDADYGAIGRWHSGDDITRWMQETHDPLGPTLHRLTNVALRRSGTGIAARSQVHAVIVTPDRSTAIHALGTYDDELVATAEGWRIARRRFTPVVVESHPAGG